MSPWEKPIEKRIVVLISGGGSNLQSIIEACASGQINGRIISVISNCPAVYGLERAAKSNIPSRIIDHTQYETRGQFDAELQQQLSAMEPDLIVLAGFMRILTEDFVSHFHGKLLNIHPSLLPAYKGLHTHQRALDDGAIKHGVSVHFATPELDGGPVILQAEVEVHNDDTAQTLAQRVLTQEHIAYPKVVEWFCAERLSLKNGVVFFDNEALAHPIILNAKNHAQLTNP